VRGERAAEHSDRLFRTGDLGSAARRVEVDLAKLLIDLAGGDALRLHPDRIELDSYLAADSAGPADDGDAFDAHQIAIDGVVDEPAQLLDGHRRAFGRHVDDRIIVIFLADHLRFEDPVGKIAANARDRVAHVGDGAIDRSPDLEHDEGRAIAFADPRRDLVDALDSANRRFDPAGNLDLELGRGGARLADRHDRGRDADVRIEIDVHPHESQPAHGEQHDEHHHRDDGMADRPGRDVTHI
jgi:hypothetical protein